MFAPEQHIFGVEEIVRKRSIPLVVLQRSRKTLGILKHNEGAYRVGIDVHSSSCHTHPS